MDTHTSKLSNLNSRNKDAQTILHLLYILIHLFCDAWSFIQFFYQHLHTYLCCLPISKNLLCIEPTYFNLQPGLIWNSVLFWYIPAMPMNTNLWRDELEKYCMCVSAPETEVESNSVQIETLESTTPVIKKKRSKKLSLHHMDLSSHCKKLESVCSQLSMADYVITAKNKSFRISRSGREISRYIGVSKNGPNWQALICINKRKTYIGSFDTQIEAARAFDMYSILINDLGAKTNFSYTKKDLMKIIADYNYSKTLDE